MRRANGGAHPTELKESSDGARSHKRGWMKPLPKACPHLGVPPRFPPHTPLHPQLFTCTQRPPRRFARGSWQWG